ncbi:MAG: peptidoglycan editing factor PgeF [Deltaproteobacteria bacterium]|nr:peptidoglycan editing factor PgeF [Deltaproteobacteria bacterium]
MALFVTSRLLSDARVVHGFSLRTGGVSEGAFASLNLSASVGDLEARVSQNLDRLSEAAAPGLGLPFATVSQVHGDRIVEALLSEQGPFFHELMPESQAGHAAVTGEAQVGLVRADAVVTRSPVLLAAVRVADCVPVLLHDVRTGHSAAVHSGWRGARLSIAARAVSALQAHPEDLLAAIGPCIGRCCYEVSRELAKDFREVFGTRAADDPETNPKPHLDLRYCVEHALLLAGVQPEHLEQVPGCTSCEPERFFSHRRDKGNTGRMLGFIAAIPPATTPA